MKERKDPQASQNWTTFMMLIPVVLLFTVAGEITNNRIMQLAYAALFGGGGALLGYLVGRFSKDKSIFIKVLSTILLITFCSLIIYLLSSKPSDSEILEQDWITQKIGNIEFDTPVKLELESNEIPESARWFYSEVNIYTDGNSERLTSFIQSEILVDTLLIEDAFEDALSAMLYNLDIDNDEVELEIFESSKELLSIMFFIPFEGQIIQGYGYMNLKGRILESIWLMPIEQGFSEAYIEGFELGITTDN